MTTQSPAQAVTDILGDLGNLVRRVQAGSIEQDEFFDTTRKMRRDLKALRSTLADSADEMMELANADLSAALARTQQRLLEMRRPLRAEAGPNRTRTYGRFAVIDGDRPFETPFQGA